MKKIITILALCLVLILISLPQNLYCQTDTEKLIKDARALSKKALSTAANIFSAKEFEQGEDYLADAENLIKKSGKPDEIQQNINSATEFFNKAMEKTKSMNTSFNDLMKFRQLALDQRGNDSEPKLWKEGEDNFLSAVEDYNDKDMEGYQKYAKLAESNYKDAELSGIKAKYLNDIKASVTLAEDKDLKKFAPITLNKTKQLVQDIETTLDANRYDTLKAGASLKQAVYQLNHGIYLQDLFKKMKEKDQSMEDLVLLWEEPLIKIAALYKVEPSFNKGYDEITSQTVSNINISLTKIDQMTKENQSMSSELRDLRTKYADAEKLNKSLTSETETLKKNLETATKSLDEYKTKFTQLESENLKYKSQSDVQEKNEQIVENLTKLFLPSEAEVIRSGDLITIRLVNIVFPVNKATLDPQYFNLLGKVQKAIQLFPNGTFVIEGHTDGQGDYQKNIDLSQSRANAIYQYFLAGMGAEAGKITVVGLGGSKPIANNSTEEGRSKNRRIEININPHFPAAK